VAKKFVVVLVVLLIAFLGYVSTRPGQFHYERNGVINASADKIFPYLSSFKEGAAWSPYEKKDLQMKKIFTGTDGQVGATMAFEGNKEVGSGKLEMLKIVPNEVVEIRLTMLEPVRGESLVQYKLTPVDGGTQFSYSMSGESGFLGKLMSTVIDCEKMVGDDFSIGIANLKTLVESKK
jgi:hypothetical protein